MAGRGNLSVNQTPVYGDKSKLAAATKTLTKTPMTGIPTPAPTAGRPVSSGAGGAQAQQQGVQPQPPAIPPEHQSALDAVAQAYRTKMFWDAVLQNYPSEWSRMYAADANRALAKATSEARTQTPFFE